MTDPESGRDRPEKPFRPYPAPGRPEQPMIQDQSPWPWVLVAAGLAVVVVLLPVIVFVVWLISHG